MLKLAPVQTFHGPNPYAAEPVQVFDLWAEDAVVFDREKARRAIAKHYPDWVGHMPPGDDAELALASLAAGWALASLNEVRGFLHEAGARREGEKVRVWIGFHDLNVSVAATRLALRAVLGAGQDALDPASIASELDSLWQACRNHHPDFQARILMSGARKAGIPVLPFVPGTKFWQYGWGKRSRAFMETMSNGDGQLGAQWQHNKATAKSLFALLGVPIAPHRLVNTEAELDEAVRAIGYPCVVKPLARGGGKGVTADIGERAMLLSAFAHARQYSPDPLMVEAHVPGEDHRLMIVAGRLVAAIRREPSSVIGDGQRSVADLVAQVNATRSANILRSRYLRPIALDAVLANHLAGQGVAVDEVLPQGRRVTLRSNANLSTGGKSTDVTGAIHPAVRAMAEQLAETIGLTTAGIDYLTTDIGLPPAESGGVVIEVNSTPGLDVLVAAGLDADALALTVLGPGVGSVPVELIVHPAEALEERLAALRAVERASGEGWVCGQELRVGAAALRVTTAEPWGTVKAALRNRMLERLRIDCSDADILRHGLPLARIERIEFAGVDLPSEWHGVAESCLYSAVAD